MLIVNCFIVYSPIQMKISFKEMGCAVYKRIRCFLCFFHSFFALSIPLCIDLFAASMPSFTDLTTLPADSSPFWLYQQQHGSVLSALRLLFQQNRLYIWRFVLRRLRQCMNLLPQEGQYPQVLQSFRLHRR